MLGLVIEPPPERYQQPIPTIEQRFDLTQRLSLELIRSHCRIDDAPGADDEQLVLYRAAALESAEQYTGLLLSCQRTVTEPIQTPDHPKPGKYTYKHKLQYPPADGLIYIYGGTHPADNVNLRVKPGQRNIEIPIRSGFIDLTNCCDPCAVNHLNQGMMAAYLAGYKDVDAIPAGIILGCLHFIAWVVEHPGDELLTMRNRLDSRGGAGVYGTNYVALASGALEQWKQYTDDI